MAERDTVALWSTPDREALFQETATRSGIGSPVAIEKDYWVYWALRTLFLSSRQNDLVFKGGTSLSKVYRVISRFSEDIDLSVDRRTLGFVDNRDPERATSRTQTLKLINEIPEACRVWVSGDLLQELRNDITKELGTEGWSIHPDPNERSTLLFSYPYALASGVYGGSSYIRPLVRLEFGGRNELWPSEPGVVTSYCAEVFPDQVLDLAVTTKVLRAERTFWEKATLLHAEHHRPERKQAGERLSRHYYDTVMLSRAGIAESALQDPKLREAVVSHKQIFFQLKWASYETAIPGSFCLMPHPSTVDALRNDYRMMNEMFFEEPPEFDQILLEIAALEKRINTLKPASESADANPTGSTPRRR
ncbi:MAG: nucleotidyl transferase AbiEii/AbiGii toxin family protein [Gemmatimonadota bacterium]|nr:nucleotidyl transferase AbiEii/AbiGii toxin family protein [Gemmatimonadota bacterium]